MQPERYRSTRLHSLIQAAVTAIALLLSTTALAQTESATLSGTIMDRTGAVIADVQVQATNSDTNATTTTVSNHSGIYVIPSLKPGRYRVSVMKQGFKQVVVTDVILNVQDTISRNFNLDPGAVSESVTVTAEGTNVNTTDATVSTVVDRNFAENLPMNGRSFQTLIDLTPGVVVTQSNFLDSGQFSVNGQRASSNYWMIDGVSANFGTGTYMAGNGFGGAAAALSAMGGTNSLVSVDALQEFRIQTSTFAPEFGRTPGAQISISTRSGTNRFHGALFDYLRNDLLDANNWFNGFVNNPPLPKAKERQNDFGGTFSGPIIKDKTFFFFSYEGLRLRLPQTKSTGVPDLAARESASAGMAPYLAMYPIPNGADNAVTGVAEFSSSFSDPATLDAYSLRLDHELTSKINLFARYNYSPSESTSRGVGIFNALNDVSNDRIVTQTTTLAANLLLSPRVSNEFRFNYSKDAARNSLRQDTFGGGVPLSSLPIPSGLTADNIHILFQIPALGPGEDEQIGTAGHNIQRQYNVTDGFSWQKGAHSLKFGIDYRRLSPVHDPYKYAQLVGFATMQDAALGQSEVVNQVSNVAASPVFHDFSAFAQDTWRISPRLTMTYGLRWDLDAAPSSLQGPSLPTLTAYDPANLATLSIAPAGTPPFKTGYANVAPRIGLAYQLRNDDRWQSVVRGGFGVFYDLASAEAGNVYSQSAQPFGNMHYLFGATYPLQPSQIAPVPIPATGTLADVAAFDPNLKLPYALQWNFAVEQSLGRDQTLTASYVGSAGRRLLQEAFYYLPPANPNVVFAGVVGNTAASDYDALQVEFQRKLSHGLQAIASYTWSHSIDNASASSYANSSNLAAPGTEDRASSDFDIRHSLSVGLTYYIPSPQWNSFSNMLLRGWSTENFVHARTAPPVDITDVTFFSIGSIVADTRPDLVPGVPVYLYGSQYPGGKAFNPAAFTDPPIDFSTFSPTRQGTTPRNYLRAFGAAQWDFAIHREFALHGEATKLQFRAEMFNVLNHPNFGPPNNSFVSTPFGGPAGFGTATQMLGQSLSGAQVGSNGAFNPIYQIGSPRSVQIALKFMF